MILLLSRIFSLSTKNYIYGISLLSASNLRSTNLWGSRDKMGFLEIEKLDIVVKYFFSTIGYKRYKKKNSFEIRICVRMEI